MGELQPRDQSPSEGATLRFNSDIGCFLPVIALTALFVGFAAARGDRFTGHSRFDRLVAETAMFSVGRVNVVLLLFALYVVWGFFTMGARWADEVAIRATEQGLTFHWTLLRRGTVPWSEVRGAELGTTTVRLMTVPQVVIRLADRVVAIRAFEDAEPGAAERLVAFIRAHAACADPR
jgi:hypothetical protein